MTASVCALLSNIIDYAGLLSPSALSREQAIRSYARHRQEAEAWMLGRLVIPTEHLLDLGLQADSAPIGLNVVAGVSNSTGAMLVSMQRELSTFAQFRERFKNLAHIHALDIKVSLLVPDLAPLVVNGLLETVDRQTNAGVTPFFEVNSPAGYRAALAALIPLLGRPGNSSRASIHQPAHCESPGLNIRCGGRRAADQPTTEELVFAITSCCEHRVPIKFTAGPHEPMRHRDAVSRTCTHGFLNILIAGVLAHARHLGEQQLREAIDDEDFTHFVFEEERLFWKDISVTLAEIKRARLELIRSFTSYQFNDQRASLRLLGLV